MEPYKVEVMRRMLQEVRPNTPEEPLRVLAKSLNGNMRKKFIVFQKWVRDEFDAKGYVEVTDEFIRDREEAQKQKGQEGQIPVDIDPYLPADKYFTDEEDDGEEKLVFSLTKKKKAASDEEWSDDEDEDESDEDEQSE